MIVAVIMVGVAMVMLVSMTMRTAMMVVARRRRASFVKRQRIGYLLGVGGLCGGQCISTPTIP